MRLSTFLLVLLELRSATSASFIPVSDPNLVFSAYNWNIENSSAASSNPGASLKFGFTGSTQVALILNTSESTPSTCVIVEASVDDGPWFFVSPTPNTLNLTVVLASNLDVATPHDVRMYLYASCEQSDRWLRRTAAAGGNAFLVISGVSLDNNASTLPPPLIHSSRALFFGDSITEGTNAANYNFNTGTCGGNFDLSNSASTDSWAFAFAEAAAVEPSMAAFAAQVRVDLVCCAVPGCRNGRGSCVIVAPLCRDTSQATATTMAMCPRC